MTDIEILPIDYSKVEEYHLRLNGGYLYNAFGAVWTREQVEALGLDVPQRIFKVSLHCAFEAKDIHEAVECFAEWAEDNVRSAGIRVKDGDRTYIVDGVGGSVYQTEGPDDGEHS